MTNQYLLTKIAPITDELLEKFKASGEWVMAYSNGEYEKSKYSKLTDSWANIFGKRIPQPKYYLPDGLPDPSAAVEVFEREVTTDSADYLCANPTEREIGCAHIFAPENMEVGDMVGVFALPSGKVAQEGEK
jgi:hypothetical protein